MEFHNQLASLIKTTTKSHENIIRAVCNELEVHDEDKIKELIKTLLDTSYSSVKAKKDPNRSKRPKSGYLYFCEEKRKQVQEDNPGAKMGDISKILGQLWKNTSDEDKVQYQDKHEEDVQRYEDEK